MSSFIGLLVLGILVFFFIYHSQYFKTWLSGAEAQADAAAALKGLVETARLANGFEIPSPARLRVRRDLSNTPADVADDTWVEYRLTGTDLHRITTPPGGGTPEDRILARGVTAFQVTNSGNTMVISMTVTRGSKTVILQDTATPRGMSLEGESLP